MTEWTGVKPPGRVVTERGDNLVPFGLHVLSHKENFIRSVWESQKTSSVWIRIKLPIFLLWFFLSCLICCCFLFACFFYFPFSWLSLCHFFGFWSEYPPPLNCLAVLSQSISMCAVWLFRARWTSPTSNALSCFFYFKCQRFCNTRTPETFSPWLCWVCTFLGVLGRPPGVFLPGP